jgi:hypothetical protein
MVHFYCAEMRFHGVVSRTFCSHIL